MRKDQSGFTLVELLIAIAIMSIVIAAVCGFIIVGSRSYASGNSDISVQQEAQLALNQMSDVLIDTTRSVNYAAYDESGTAVLGLKDAEFAFEPAGKMLYVSNGVKVKVDDTNEVTEESNGNANYQFYWDKAEETLFFYSTVNAVDENFCQPGDPGWVVLAENVTEFSIDLTQVEEKRIVQIAMTFVNGNKEYKTSNNITIRNKVGVNDAEIPALNRSVELTVTPKEISVILEPGEEYHFSTPKVSGKNVLDKSVVWSVEGSGSGEPPAGGSTPDGSAFIDTDNGIIRIASTETAASFKVVITTNAKDSQGNHASATVVVYVKRAHSVTLSKRNAGDGDTSAASELSAGQDFIIDANVEGVQLGVACDGCSNNVSRDKDVVTGNSLYGWQVTEGADLIAAVNETTEKQASFTLSNQAKKGDTITIQATSYHSVQLRNGGVYGPVQGTITLTVTKQRDADWVPLSKGLQYGYGDHRYNDIPAAAGLDYTHVPFIVCVRVRESLDANKDDDKVLLYYAIGGSDISIFPDLFDLDLQKSYYFLVQVLDPVGEGVTRDQIRNMESEIIADYNANLDDNGKYIGNKAASKQYITSIDNTALAFNYKNELYLDKSITYDTVYLANVESTIMSKIYPNYYDSHNVFQDSIVHAVTYSIYMGDGDDMSGWKKLYYLDPDSLSYVNADGSGNTIRNGSITVDLQQTKYGDTPMYDMGDPFLKFDFNSSHKADACGTYHIVPGLVYRNGYRDGKLYYPDIESRYEIIYQQNVVSDHTKFKAKYYEYPNSTMHITVKLGNLHFDNSKFKGDVYFPYPSDGAFPFEKGMTDVQYKSDYWFAGYPTSGGSKQWIGYEKVSCKYIAAKDIYEIEFSYSEWSSELSKVVTRSGGVYQCSSDGTEWEMVKVAY